MPARPAHPAGQVRVIGGEFRRRILHFPELAGLRPTPDRARETLFNWLGQDLAGQACLDAFAGSGALGFEAASRHAARVLMLESARPACDALKRNCQLLKADCIEIRQLDALAWMRSATEQFDVIFLDPPFAAGLMAQALPLAVSRLKADGWLYVEQPDKILAPEGFIIHRQDRAGLSHFALLKRD